MAVRSQRWSFGLATATASASMITSVRVRSFLLFSLAIAGCSLDGLTGGSRPADAGDDASDASDASDAGDAVPCALGGYYCGGAQIDGAKDTLYRCESGTTGSLIAKCANGCIVMPGENDRCSDATSCVVGGSYCGGDKVNGDPNVLYRCEAGGGASVIRRCANGCRVNPPGNDDDCVP